MSEPRSRARPCVSLLALAILVPLGAAAAQQGDAVLHAPLAVLPVDSPPFQRLLDIDGDGDLDAVGSRIHENRSSAQIAVWRNDGGAFTEVFRDLHAMGGYAHPVPRSLSIAVADFDGDGVQDFVASGGHGSEVFRSRPGFTFQRSVHSNLGSWIYHNHAVATGDLDGDGLQDFVAVGRDIGQPLLFVDVYLGNGTTLATTVASLGGPPTVSTADVWGDGRPEILVSEGAYPTNGGITLRLLQVSGGQLVRLPDLTTTLTYPGTPYLWMGGDLDGDGDGDVVVFHPELGTNGIPRYQIFRRTGATALTRENEAIGGPAEYLADIDGDGDLDGVCCGGGSPTYNWPKLDFASTFEIAINRGGGDFARAWTIPGAGSESMAGAADIDGDGDVDFVAGRCVYYGRGPWLQAPMPTAAGRNASVVLRRWLIYDHDRDGDPDLYASGWGGQRNRGNGEFVLAGSSISPPAGRGWGGGFSADVDGDGARDMVLPQFIGGTFEMMVLVRNNGGGHYQYAGPVAAPGVRIGAGFSVDHLFAGDVDGDGDDDLITNNNPRQGTGGPAQIWWNQSGTFVPGPVFSWWFAAGRVEAMRDFDGDGRTDLFLSRNGTPMVMRATGDPVTPFAEAWVGTAGILPFEPAAVVEADVNDDGRMDFVALTWNSSVGYDLGLFVNVTPPGGPIAFQFTTLPGIAIYPWTQNTSTPPTTVTAGDFDGDGRTDLAIGLLKGEPNLGLLLLRRTGDGQVPTLADYQQCRQAFVDGFATDVDGDGDLDLVGSYVTYNARHHGIDAGSRVQVGTGVAGEAGAVPVLGATGPFRGGFTETLLLRGVPGPGLAVMAFAFQGANLPGFPLPGMTTYLDPTSLSLIFLSITQSGEGRAAASTALSIALPHGFGGLPFHVQAFVLDPAAPQGATCSNGLIKRIGN